MSTETSGSVVEAALAVEPSSTVASHVSHRHHYVPRFILAGFTPSGRHSDHLWVFDNQRLKPERRTPKAVAFEFDYYAVDIPGQPADLVEGFFGKVESLAAPIVRQMIHDRAIPTGEDYANLMYFLGLMFGRLSPMRETLKQFHEERAHLRVKIAASSPEAYEATVRGMPPEKRPTYEMVKKWAAEEKFVEIANPSVLHTQAIMFGLDSGSPQLLGQRKWSLLLAKDDELPFICSDAPVSLVATDAKSRPYVPPGLIYQETDFIMPLSQTAALLGRFEGRSEVVDVGDEVVACINTRMMWSARRYIYAPTDEFKIMEPNLRIVSGSGQWLRSTDVADQIK